MTTPSVLDGVLVDVGNTDRDFCLPVKPSWNVKSTGVAATVTHNQSANQVPSYLIDENDRNLTEHTESPYGLFTANMTAIGVQKLRKNSKALNRLKKKIERQKERQLTPVKCTSGQDDLRTRKIAKGPPAPLYKGFSATKTRIKTVSVPQSEQATSAPFTSTAKYESKQDSKLHAGAPNHGTSVRKIGSKGHTSRVTTGRLTASTTINRKTIITPSSWREGQRITESILGPTVRHPKIAGKASASNATTRKRTPKEDTSHSQPVVPSAVQVVKHQKKEPADGEPGKEKIRKVRHYDQSAVQLYIAKKQEERKRKKSQERKAYREAQTKKQKQLEELYRKQKATVVAKRNPVEAENANPETTLSMSQTNRQTECSTGGKESKLQPLYSSDKEKSPERISSLAKFDQHMDLFLGKLDSIPKTTSVPVGGLERSKTTIVPNLESTDLRAPSEFSEKLDQYLEGCSTDKHDSVKLWSHKENKTSVSQKSASSSRLLPGNESLSYVGRNSAFPSNVHATGSSPKTDWRRNPVDEMNIDHFSHVRTRAERILALKNRADCLDEKMDVTLKLVERPIMPKERSLEDVDRMLRGWDNEYLRASLPGTAGEKNKPAAKDENWDPSDDISYSAKSLTVIPELAGRDMIDGTLPTREKFESYEYPTKVDASERVLPDWDNSEHSLENSSHHEVQEEILEDLRRMNQFSVLSIGERYERNDSPISAATCPAASNDDSKPPWQNSSGGKHSIINVCLGELLKKRSRKDEGPKPIERANERSPVATRTGGDIQSSLQGGSPFLRKSQKSSHVERSVEDYPRNREQILPPKLTPAVTMETAIVGQHSPPRYGSKDIQQPYYEETSSIDSSDMERVVATAAMHVNKSPPDLPSESEAMHQDTSQLEYTSEKGFDRFPIYDRKLNPAPVDNSKKFSPASLEQKLLAELNYQESIDETLHHLAGVESTQRVASTQQDSVSLAQLVKTQQLLHGFDLERAMLQAKEAVLDQERRIALSRGNEPVGAEDTAGIKETSQRVPVQPDITSSTSSTVDEVIDRRKIRGFRDTNTSSTSSSYESMSGLEPVRRNTEEFSKTHPATESNDNGSQESREKTERIEKRKFTQSPPQSDNAAEILDDDDDDDDDDETEKSDERDDTIEEVISNAENDSFIDSEKSITRSEEKLPPSKAVKRSLKMHRDEDIDVSLADDHTSDSSSASFHFNESLTEDEIAEISRRAVVASEGHRRHHRHRTNDQPRSSRKGATYDQKEGGIDSISRRTVLNEGEFLRFMDDIVRQYMQEEEFRAKHQAAMLHLRKRAIKEKTEAELAMLKKMKQQARKKGEDEKMPPLKKKQRAIIRRYKMEYAEIKKLKAVAKAASHERKLFLQKSATRRLMEEIDQGDRDSSASKEELKDEMKEFSLDSPPLLDSKPTSDNNSNSELDASSSSSVMMKKLKLNMRNSDEQKLTKREQLLMKRKKQAEQLIAWKERLDREERQVCDIEKKALRTWDKDGASKSSRKKMPDDFIDRSSGSNENSESFTGSSIAEEIVDETGSAHDSRPGTISVDRNTDNRNQDPTDETDRRDNSRFSEVKPGTHRKATSESESVSSPTKTVPRSSDTQFKPADVSLTNKHSISSRPTTIVKESIPSTKASLESWSDESFSQTPSETEQSDIECRVRALREELNSRRLIAERLKKKQKQRHKDRLKAQEASLRSQIEAYDIFIRKTQDELNQELEHHLNATGTVSKPQIRSPRKNKQLKQLGQSTAAPSESLSGHGNVAGISKLRTESESSEKLSHDEEERVDDIPSNGTTVSGSTAVGHLPGKPHENIETLSTLAKLSKQAPGSGLGRSLSSSTEKPRSLIPVPSRKSMHASKMSSPPSFKLLSSQVTSPSSTTIPSKSLDQKTTSDKTELEECQVSATIEEKEKSIDQPPSPSIDDGNIPYSDDFDSSTSTRKASESFMNTDEDISEHLDDVSLVSSEKSFSKSDAQYQLLQLNDKPVVPQDDAIISKQEDHSVEDQDDLASVSSSESTHSLSAQKFHEPKEKEESLPFTVGERVVIAERDTGVVRFVGEVSFAPGLWVGVELQRPCGKNDGSVKGKRYFTCSPNYGLFAPAARVACVVEDSDDSSSTLEKKDIHEEQLKDDDLVEVNGALAKPEEKAMFDKSSESNRDLGKKADQLASGLLDSLLENSIDQALGRYSQRKLALKRQSEEEKENEEEVASGVHEALADSFTGDLFQDTIEKVMEIRKQRAKKWIADEQRGTDSTDHGENLKSVSDNKLDYGREVEDIFGMSRTAEGEGDAEEKESSTPVRPVSPVLGASQDDWFEDEIAVSTFHKTPVISAENLKPESEIWQGSRLMEVLSSYIDSPTVPIEPAVSHDPNQILKLVENSVAYFHTKYVQEKKIDLEIPEFLYSDDVREFSGKENEDTDENATRKERDVNANRVFQTSLFDMVRELVVETFHHKSLSKVRSQSPKWQKKRVFPVPMYRSIPDTLEDLQKFVRKQISKLLNLYGDSTSPSQRTGMKWGSQRKKDRVDHILIQELRVEEPEWTNYDEDETTVKMQLTDTILDMLLTDSIHCLDRIQTKCNNRKTRSESPSSEIRSEL